MKIEFEKIHGTPNYDLRFSGTPGDDKQPIDYLFLTLTLKPARARALAQLILKTLDAKGGA